MLYSYTETDEEFRASMSLFPAVTITIQSLFSSLISIVVQSLFFHNYWIIYSSMIHKGVIL